MTTVTVSNSTALVTALKAAHAGDTILLAPGSYAYFSLLNYNKGGTVNITSASSTNQAVLNGFKIQGSSGLSFSNLVLSTASYASGYPYGIYGSSNISLTKLNVHGTLANMGAANGLYFSQDSNISVTSSQFQQLATAITEGNNTNVKIENNTFTQLSSDGVDNTAATDVVISGNAFSNFQSATGVHPDAIQFWTQGQTKGSSNITISNNTITQGSGGQFQGIFMTDQVGTLPYQNVTISNNTVVGGLWNGIDLSHAVNAMISGNTLTSLVDPTVVNPAVSRLIAFDLTSATVANNVAAQVLFNANETAVTQTNNSTNSYITATNTQLKATAPAQSVADYHSVSGAITMTDSAGGNPIVAQVNSKAVASGSAGTTFNGAYGQLVMHQDGTYTYTATKDGLTVGPTYTDNFTETVTDSHGQSTNLLMMMTVTGSGTGTSAANTIVAGSGAETITGLGGADTLTSGTGPDTFAYTGVSDSTPTAYDTIKGFKAGDIIDLAGVDAQFQLVSAFDHHAHELMIVNDGGGTWDIYGDTTGSGTANFKIHLTGATTPITAASLHI